MSAPIVVTGISGFIAKHVAVHLLKKGYAVRGTVRDLGKTDTLRHTLAQAAKVDPDQLSFVQADLLKDDGWTDALRNCGGVLHLASPFPIQQPSDREALVPAARGGTMRVLNAANVNDIARVVLTSSIVAMAYRAGRSSDVTLTEEAWTDPEWEGCSPYIVSKTRAEQEAWRWAESFGGRERLTVVNPGFVLGPLLDDRVGTSAEVLQLLFQGAYPAVPPIAFPVVDVRDLADLHIAALENEATAGRRLLGAGDTLTMQQMGLQLKADFPEAGRKVPTRQLPAFMVRMMALFDRSLKTILPDLGVTPHARSGYVTDLTGIRFRPARETVRDAGASLIERGLA
ncbi:MAG: NAD-dependent epimerase/dehydratase family protein [Bacteroidota bacterium]